MKLCADLAPLLAAALLAGCASSATRLDTSAQRINLDYAGRGDVTTVRAFVYGPRTVVQFLGTDLVWGVSVTDAEGRSVAFDRIGRYFRLSSRVQDFTVHYHLLSAAHFTAVLAAAGGPVRLVPARPPVAAAGTSAPIGAVSTVPANRSSAAEGAGVEQIDRRSDPLTTSRPAPDRE